MGKPRRPKGPRSTWEPKPVPDGIPVAAVESADPEAPTPSIDRLSQAPADTAPGDTTRIAVVTAEATSSAAAQSGPASAAGSAMPAAVAEAIPADPGPSREPETTGRLAPFAPAHPAADRQMAFLPERVDLVGIGDAITGYVRGESEAAAAHARALGSARSPADMIRLQVGEFQRAADACLTCWSQVAHKASRAFAYR